MAIIELLMWCTVTRMSYPSLPSASPFRPADDTRDIYRLLCKQAGMIVYDHHLDTGHITWDGAISELLGYSPEEFQHVDIRQWEAWLHPDDRANTRRALDQTIANSQPWDVIYRLRHRNGSYVHIHERSGFVTGGGRRRMIGSLRDVSDSRLRAQALTGLLERVVGAPGRAFFEQLALELWRTLDAVRVYVGRLSDDNDEMLPLALCYRGTIEPLKRYKVANSLSASVLHRGDGLLCCWGNPGEVLPPHVAEAFSTWGATAYVGCALITPTGYRVGVLSALFQQPPARREAVIAILQAFAARAAAEIERRETENALRASEARFRSLSESSPVGVYQFDVHGNCTYVNKRWCEITGISFKEALQKGWRERLPPDELRELLAAWEKFTSGRGEFSHKLRFEHPAGGARWIQFHARRLPGPGGTLAGYVGTIDDITVEMEAKNEIHQLNAHLEERVAERTAQLAAANAELEAFSYSVSHDLRSPLRAIDGFSRAIAEDYESVLDDTGRDYLRRIRDASQRMAMLIDDLLRLSRATRTQMHIDAIDLAQLAHQVVGELRQADRPDRVVEFVCPPTLPVRADRDLMRIVLDNLLGNAWKYTRRQSKPRVEISHTPDPEDPTSIVYTVSDNGAGFDMKYAGKLFAPFQRLHSASEFEGTGIGLATVRRIISRHGGRVWAESVPDQGTQIHFTLKPATSTS